VTPIADKNGIILRMTDTAVSMDISPPDFARIRVNSIILVCFFVSSYVELTIPPIAGLNFPNIGCFVIALTSIYLNKRLVSRQSLNILLLIIGLLLADAILFSLTGGLFKKRLSASLQLCLSLTSAYGVFLAVTQVPRQQLSRIFCIIFLVLLIGSTLEIVGLLRPVSDFVRSLLYGYNVYSSDLRDVTQYGGVRPKFFSKEPSLVGIYGGFVLTAWILTRQNDSIKNVITSVVFLSIAFALLLYVIRSPTLLFFYIIALCGVFFLSTPPEQKKTQKFIIAILVVTLFGFLLLPIGYLVGKYVFSFFMRRLFGDYSVFIRIVAPTLVALDVLKATPLLGVGAGAYPSLQPYLADIYSAFGYIRLDYGANGSVWISNAFWEYWMWWGAGGGIFMVYILRSFLRSLGLQETIFPFVALALVLQNGGGVIACRYWFFFMFYAAAVFVREKMRQNRVQLSTEGVESTT
jgi:hypothetical protein